MKKKYVYWGIKKMFASEIQILKIIDKKKLELYQIANKSGINSKETLTCSQELDKLIHLYFTRMKS